MELSAEASRSSSTSKEEGGEEGKGMLHETFMHMEEMGGVRQRAGKREDGKNRRRVLK